MASVSDTHLWPRAGQHVNQTLRALQRVAGVGSCIQRIGTISCSPSIAIPSRLGTDSTRHGLEPADRHRTAESSGHGPGRGDPAPMTGGRAILGIGPRRLCYLHQAVADRYLGCIGIATARCYRGVVAAMAAPAIEHRRDLVEQCTDHPDYDYCCPATATAAAARHVHGDRDDQGRGVQDRHRLPWCEWIQHRQTVHRSGHWSNHVCGYDEDMEGQVWYALDTPLIGIVESGSSCSASQKGVHARTADDYMVSCWDPGMSQGYIWIGSNY